LLDFLPSDLIPDLESSKWSINATAKCNLCGNLGAITFRHKLYPDFNLNDYDHIRWIDKFREAEDGVCMHCGHFQRYSCLNLEELDEYLKIFTDKAKTSQGLVSLKSQGMLDDSHSQIIKHIKCKFQSEAGPKCLYIARPSSAELIGIITETYNGSEIIISENNQNVLRAIDNMYGNQSWISITNEYEVHGRIDIPDESQFNILIHCLQHSISLRDDLSRIERSVKHGARILLLDEVQRKLHNPFHVNHLTEAFLMRELRSRGLKVELIQDVTSEADQFIKGLQSVQYKTGIYIYG